MFALDLVHTICDERCTLYFDAASFIKREQVFSVYMTLSYKMIAIKDISALLQWVSRHSGWDHGPKTITQIRQEAADVSTCCALINNFL